MQGSLDNKRYLDFGPNQ